MRNVKQRHGLSWLVGILLVVAAAGGTANADSTLVSGTIVNQTWTVAGSPYCVVGDIHVAGLTINPGVYVRFEGNYVFEVAGLLNAVGTEQDSIFFEKSQGSSGWKGIFFNFSNQGSVLSYCMISGSTQSGIRCASSSPQINYCTIKQNSTTGYGAGIYATNSSLLLSNVVIDSNVTTGRLGGGIYYSGALSLNDCRITNNRVLWYGSNQASAGAGIFNAGGPLRLNRCVLIDNSCISSNSNPYRGAEAAGGGIYHTSDSLIMNNCQLHGNLAHAGANTDYEIVRGGALYIYSGMAQLNGCLIDYNSLGSREYWSGSYARGGGVYIYSGQMNIHNCTFAYNSYEGIWCSAGTADTVINSIFFFNSRQDVQGTAVVSYSDLQDGYSGEGNINLNPVFLSENTLQIVEGSPCIDSGNPNPAYNDACLPPALGTTRNDMGAHGGSSACGWIQMPTIICPQSPIQAELCNTGSVVKVPVSILNATNATANGSPILNDSIEFVADHFGLHTFEVIATNGSGADTCQFTVNVNLNIPMHLDITSLNYSAIDTASVPPAAKVIHINSACQNGSLSWHLSKIIGGDWLQMSKTSGFNPDSVSISVNPHGYTPGIYKAKLEFTADNSSSSPIRVPVTMFVESGTDVGEDIVKPGSIAKIPITINAAKPLKGFTIPLRYFTNQSQYLTLDSVSINNSLIDSVLYPNDTDMILKRIVQEPPLPDSTYEIGTAYFTVALGASMEYVPIDTMTISVDGQDYSYEFTYANDSVGVPLYNPGAIIITQCDNLPIIAASDHIDTVACGLVCFPLNITDANTVTVSGAESASWSNGQLCFQADNCGILYTLDLLAENDCGFSHSRVSVFVEFPKDSLVLKIADVAIDYGTCDTVAITVSDSISNLAGFEFHISYDPAIVRVCDGMVLTDLSVTKNDTGNTLHIAWANLSSPLVLNAGDTILSLLFEAIGDAGEVSPLTWLPNSQVISEESTLISRCRYRSGGVEVSIPADNICGEIVYYKDLETAVPEVNVTLDGSVSRKDTTDDAGLFCFDEVANGSYEITPQKDNNDPGVTISDAVLIQRYVVRLDEFTPYQLVAGDVNNDCRVSITDVVAILNKITLISSLPSGNWAFVDRAYDINTTNWCAAPDSINLVKNESASLNNDFVGVRKGDVNGDWHHTAGTVAKTLFVGNSNAILQIGSADGENNGSIEIPVNVTNAEQVAGFELHLTFDSKKLHYSGYNTELDGKIVVNAINDEIHIAWMDVEKPIYASSITDLISLEFEAIDMADSALFTLDQAVIADSRGCPYRIETVDGYVGLKAGIIPEGYSLHQNYPNPFNPSTTIQLAMPTSGQYEIGIYNIVGQKIKTFTGFGEAGIVRVEWNGCNDREEPVASGIYLYKVAAGEFRDSRKMLLLK